jgi:hypothetical protein
MLMCMQTGELAMGSGGACVWWQTRACGSARGKRGFGAHPGAPELI